MPDDKFQTGQGRRHRVFIDEADRLTDDTGYTGSDLDTLAIQRDTGKAYFLQSTNPTFWGRVGQDATALLTPLWKDDVPGNLFIDGDTVAMQFGRRAMFLCEALEVVTLDLPAITVANVSFVTAFHQRQTIDKELGSVRLNPDGTDAIETRSAGQTVELVEGNVFPWMTLESDGNGVWNVINGLFTGALSDFSDV